MTREKIINSLKLNIETAQTFIKGKQSPTLQAEIKGLIRGYEFALVLLEDKDIAL